MTNSGNPGARAMERAQSILAGLPVEYGGAVHLAVARGVDAAIRDAHVDCVPWRLAIEAMGRVRRAEGVQADTAAANVRLLERVLDDDAIRRAIAEVDRAEEAQAAAREALEEARRAAR
jgi:hypothetical protein